MPGAIREMPFWEFREACEAVRRAQKREDEARFTAAAFPVWLEHGAAMRVSFSAFLEKIGLAESEKSSPASVRLKSQAAIARAEEIKQLHQGAGGG